MRVPSCRFKSCYPHQAQNKSRESRLVLCFSKDSWDLKRRRNEWTSSGRPERRPTKRRSARIKSCYPHQAQNKSRESRLVLCFSKDSWDLKRRRNEWTSSGRPERRPTKRRSARIKLRTVRSVLVYPKNRIYSASVLQVLFSGYFFRASLNVLPALKAGTVEAGMSIVAPVAGLCPVRAGLLRD